MWYVRGAGRGLSQLDRAENQWNVLKAILTKGLSLDMVADPLRFTQFIGNAAKRVRVDNSLIGSELSTAVSLRVRPGAIRLLAVSQALRTDNMDNYMQK
jgi:polyisoprenyl-teichoic acid--peptidoglycan teichoic acid transferase